MTKSKNRKFSNGSIIDGLTLESQLGVGGNGEVWKAITPDGNYVAIKLLKSESVSDETYNRFKNEISILEQVKDFEGIIPIISKSIPESKSEAIPWFTMPIATPFNECIMGKKPIDIIKDFIDLGKTIARLHARKISHRDIKPANFLYYNERLSLSDFGLVKYPGSAVITPERRDVGAKFTMAPEMRRIAHQADGLPADVYSFAKSLWIGLTRKELGFDGQYNPASPTLALSSYIPETYTTTLDRLLSECTETDPNKRPNISVVIERLNEWVSISNDFHTRNLREWTELTHSIFPLGSPIRASWSDIDTICTVISSIAKTKGLNHIFYPDGGGDTITGVSRAAEPGMIALHAGERRAEILKPKKLTYESFGRDTSWSYFRLEAAPVEETPIENAKDYEGIKESLTEVTPGKYHSYACWQHNDLNGDFLPDSARPISRFLKGCFVFFSTRSMYNLDSSTYDARHNKMTEDEFRTYIERNANDDDNKF